MESDAKPTPSSAAGEGSGLSQAADCEESLPKATTAECPVPEETAFPGFVCLPAELRLQIWREALQLPQGPRIINIFLQCRRASPQRQVAHLAVPNLDQLQQTDVIGNLLATNHEARMAAQAYLAENPSWRPQENPSWWEWVFDLGPLLQRLRVDPTRDILFLSGVDLENPRLGVPSRNIFRLPNAPLLSPGPHSLHYPESIFLRLFRNVIMPVDGGVENQKIRGIFDSPFLVLRDRGLPMHVLPANSRFLILVGGYKGRKLQLGDLEVIPEDVISQICSGLPTGASLRTIALAIRCVLRASHGFRVAFNELDEKPPSSPPSHGHCASHKLLFVRVKEEVRNRLTQNDVYLPKRMESHAWELSDNRIRERVRLVDWCVEPEYDSIERARPSIEPDRNAMW